MADLIERIDDNNIRITKSIIRQVERKEVDEQIRTYDQEIESLQARRAELVALIPSFTAQIIGVTK
ncbi:MAG: hypothetical protein DRJ03_27550 [Chloroflexi bacterium]|nr:MAG: hypothetical protein DRJ03_27550 [Chloroflexota bacterium]